MNRLYKFATVHPHLSLRAVFAKQSPTLPFRHDDAGIASSQQTLLAMTSERLRKFFRLASNDRRLILQALGWVAAVRLSLWIVPFRFLRASFTHSAENRTTGKTPVISTARIAWAIMTASRYVPRASCLTQALATLGLLRRHGYSADLRIGVALDEAQNLQAHAWVESEGNLVIGGTGLEHYTPLASPNVRESRAMEGADAQQAIFAFRSHR